MKTKWNKKGTKLTIIKDGAKICCGDYAELADDNCAGLFWEEHGMFPFGPDKPDFTMLPIKKSKTTVEVTHKHGQQWPTIKYDDNGIPWRSPVPRHRVWKTEVWFARPMTAEERRKIEQIDTYENRGS